MRSVFEFQDYRSYLRHFYSQSKERDTSFSYAKFARLAKLGSPNYLKLVIDGQRNLSPELICRFGKALSLLPAEQNYFESLVQWNQAGDEETRVFYEKRLKHYSEHVPQRSAKVDVPEILGEWFFPALVLSLNHQKRDSAVQQASRSFGIDPTFLDRRIDELLKRDLLRIDENGRIQLTFSHAVFRDQKSLSSIHKVYLGSQLQRSLHEFRTRYGEGPRFISHTFTIQEKYFQEIGDRFYDLLQSFTKETEASEGQTIVQINSQLFELSKLQLE